MPASAPFVSAVSCISPSGYYRSIGVLANGSFSVIENCSGEACSTRYLSSADGSTRSSVPPPVRASLAPSGAIAASLVQQTTFSADSVVWTNASGAWTSSGKRVAAPFFNVSGARVRNNFHPGLLYVTADTSEAFVVGLPPRGWLSSPHPCSSGGAAIYRFQETNGSWQCTGRFASLGPSLFESGRALTGRLETATDGTVARLLYASSETSLVRCLIRDERTMACAKIARSSAGSSAADFAFRGVLAL